MAMMLPQQPQPNNEPTKLQRFAELRWLDAAISFIFRLLAKLAEPFLAFGLVASAIDYGSHGHLLENNARLMMTWVSTQALALEGSGGVALAMSFDAAAQGDSAKSWTQRILAFALMLVGGVMFFSEMSAQAPGFKDAMSSPFYVFTMAGLRTLVALGYIAVCRTKDHRYSIAPAQTVIAAQCADDIAQQIEDAANELRDEVRDELRNDLQRSFDEMRSVFHAQHLELRDAMQGQLAEIPAQINAAAQAMTYEVDPAQLSAQINAIVAQSIDQAMSATHTTQAAQIQAQINAMRSDLQARIDQVVAHRGAEFAQRNATTDELAQTATQTSANDAQGDALPENASLRTRILRYIDAQRAQGNAPEAKEIALAFGCALRTAQTYRKEALEA